MATVTLSSLSIVSSVSEDYERKTERNVKFAATVYPVAKFHTSMDSSGGKNARSDRIIPSSKGWTLPLIMCILIYTNYISLNTFILYFISIVLLYSTLASSDSKLKQSSGQILPFLMDTAKDTEYYKISIKLIEIAKILFAPVIGFETISEKTN